MDSSGGARRLTAILSADVVGYSRLMGLDEAGTVTRLKAHRTELIEPTIARHHGRVVKLMGDGILVEFASVVDALACAVAVQEAMAARQRAEPEDERIRFRVGINIGDVIVEGDDIYGDGVNVAARLQELAEPDAIYLSDDAYRQVRGRLDLTLEDIGVHTLKNIAEPAHVWRWAGAAADSPAETDDPAPPSMPDKPSIAVLPFANMSADPEQEYFADGITEDIITDISKVSGLFVIARNSVFTYKGKAVRVDEVCRDLGVRYALEGSVRKAGNRVRVTAQLIDGADGGHLWAERYDRDLDDIFAVQDDVTRNIVDALKVKLTVGEKQRLAHQGTANLEAYDCYLRARKLSLRFTKEHNSEAQRLLRKALELDPSYATALAGLSNTYLQEWNQARSARPEDSLERAYETARRAVEMDDGLADAHAVLGFALLWKKSHEASLAELKKSIELDPNGAGAHYYYSLGLSWSGYLDEAIAEAEVAIRLDPTGRPHFMFAVGHARYMKGQYEEAAQCFEESTRGLPNFMPSFFFLAVCHVKLGHPEEARTALQAALAINPNVTVGWLRRTLPYRNPDAMAALTDAAQEVGLPA